MWVTGKIMHKGMGETMNKCIGYKESNVGYNVEVTAGGGKELNIF